MEPLTVLVIPDSHAEPDQDLTRYTLLGRMICHIFSSVPGKCVVVNIGDWFDMPSLNSFDRPGSRAFEGRRYQHDIEAGLEAQRLMWTELEDWNRWRRGKHILDIDWHYTLGNHEARITRAIESNPAKLEGVLSLDDLTEGSPVPWTVHPFMTPVFLGGVAFCHYYASGVMGRAIGGENPASSILRKQMTSCVQGHTHTLDWAERTATSGKKLSALVCGYYGLSEEWAGPQVNNLWTPGIAVLRDVIDGEFDFEWWSMRRIVKHFA